MTNVFASFQLIVMLKIHYLYIFPLTCVEMVDTVGVSFHVECQSWTACDLFWYLTCDMYVVDVVCVWFIFGVFVYRNGK